MSCVPEVSIETNLLPASFSHLRLSRPWSHVALDFVTSLRPLVGNSAILTIVDHFSKSAHFIPLDKLPTSVETPQLLVNHVFQIHGIPTDIVSDRGRWFISQVLRSFCSALGALVSHIWLPFPVQRSDGEM